MAQLTNGLLEEGAGDWSANTIADRLDQVGAQLATSCGATRLRGAAQPHRPALSATRRRNRRPLAEGTKFRSRRGGAGAPANADGAPERAQSPGAIAQDAFFKALYGDHPYGSPADGTPASLNAITRADIQDFHRRYYTAANAVVAIVMTLTGPPPSNWPTLWVGGLPKGEPMPPPRRSLLSPPTRPSVFPILPASLYPHRPTRSAAPTRTTTHSICNYAGW
ncbi:MAG: hypothetical protein R3F44_08710 [Candidatus Competibacteraceae bacterium]